MNPGSPPPPALSPPVCLCSADPQALCHPTSAGLVPVSQGPAAEAPAQPLPGSPASRSHCSPAQQAGNRGRGVRVMLLPLPRALTHAVLPVPVEPPPRGAGALEAALGVDAALVAAAVAHAALVHVCSTGGGGGEGKGRRGRTAGPGHPLGQKGWAFPDPSLPLSLCTDPGLHTPHM